MLSIIASRNDKARDAVIGLDWRWHLLYFVYIERFYLSSFNERSQKNKSLRDRFLLNFLTFPDLLATV